jgi:GNAT superfamily N-acetyltransferase
MGTSIASVVTGPVLSGIDEATLTRFCSLEPRQELSMQAVRIHLPDAMYLAERDGIPAGRCSIWCGSTAHLAGQRIGLIGQFAVQSADVAMQLLDFACAKLRAAGCTLAVGPMDGSTWRRYRLITWRGADPLFFLEPDNPDEWPAHFEAAGFTPLAHYYSSKCDDLDTYPTDARLDARLRGSGYRTRPLEVTRLDEELGTLWRIANDAFSRNFLYTPISETEFRQMYAPTVSAISPELVQIAEHEGVPVGVMFAVPDLLQRSAGRHVDTLILKTLGVINARHGHGIGDWLVDGAFAQGRALGFRKGVFALMHENNVSRKMGHGRMRDIRRYTLYARPL